MKNAWKRLSKWTKWNFVESKALNKQINQDSKFCWDTRWIRWKILSQWIRWKFVESEALNEQINQDSKFARIQNENKLIKMMNFSNIWTEYDETDYHNG